MKNIGIIGPNQDACSAALYAFGLELGAAIAALGHVIFCGGRGGFMEAVCRGAKQSGFTFYGQTVGILPGSTPQEANPYVDIVIPTGVGVARNNIIINSVDLLVAAGGGAGTLSELAFAWSAGKKVLCLTGFGGWAAELAGRRLDERQQGLLIAVNSVEEVLGGINEK